MALMLRMAQTKATPKKLKSIYLAVPWDLHVTSFSGLVIFGSSSSASSTKACAKLGRLQLTDYIATTSLCTLLSKRVVVPCECSWFVTKASTCHASKMNLPAILQNFKPSVFPSQLVHLSPKAPGNAIVSCTLHCTSSCQVDVL